MKRRDFIRNIDQLGLVGSGAILISAGLSSCVVAPLVSKSIAKANNGAIRIKIHPTSLWNAAEARASSWQ
ncbi:MAG: hypothetical protein H7240_02585 [Glaciimonas sp.]|nr:hypothetical protein [Glaciimonas sp.]